MRYTEAGTNYSHIVGYAYDALNNLTSLAETINGTEHTTSYTYDSDNRVSSVGNGKANEAYTYDNYSRLTKKVTNNVIGETTTTVLTDTFTYRSSSTGTTGQVAKLVSDAAAYDVTYEYTYSKELIPSVRIPEIPCICLPAGSQWLWFCREMCRREK